MNLPALCAPATKYPRCHHVEQTIAVDSRYFRHAEVYALRADSGEAHAKPGWRHRTGLPNW